MTQPYGHPPVEGGDAIPADWQPALSHLRSLIATDGGDLVVVLSKEVQRPFSASQAHGSVRFAAAATRQFKQSTQASFYNWDVSYVPEHRCFVALRRSLVGQMAERRARQLGG